MDISFEKWHGCQNDFIVLNITDADGDVLLNSLKRIAPTICNRHSGIGADGILVLWKTHRNTLAPHKLSIINKDGTIAKNCGNGLRCAASSIAKNLREKDINDSQLEMIEIEVEGHTKICTFMKPNEPSSFVSVEMGLPIVNEQITWWKDAQNEIQNILEKNGLNGKITSTFACEIGNSHLVLTSDYASRNMLQFIGPILQISPFWDGINVHLVKSAYVTEKDRNLCKKNLGGNLGELFQAFVWERGVGETMACGSGAVAIGKMTLSTGLVHRDEWIGVDMPGGRLYVKQEDNEDPVLLSGPSEFIFRGLLTI